jgi:hypothetical protein
LQYAIFVFAGCSSRPSVVSDRLQQKGMRNGVEKGPDIKVQYSR